MIYQLLGKMIAYKCNRDFVYYDSILSPPVCFVETGVSVSPVKIIDAHIILRTFVFDDVVFAENLSNVLLYLYRRILFDNQYIDFLWLCAELMLIFKDQIFRLPLQLNLNPGIKGRMPL